MDLAVYPERSEGSGGLATSASSGQILRFAQDELPLKTPMNQVLVRVFLIHCFCVAVFAADAPRERMLRLATAFNTADVPRAGTQNFDVAQDERGIIYVGNLAGVLEYDGVRW